MGGNRFGLLVNVSNWGLIAFGCSCSSIFDGKLKQLKTSYCLYLIQRLSLLTPQFLQWLQTVRGIVIILTQADITPSFMCLKKATCCSSRLFTFSTYFLTNMWSIGKTSQKKSAHNIMRKNCEFFYKTSKSNRIFNLHICLNKETDKKDMVLKESSLQKVQENSGKMTGAKEPINS